tara:strand:- start:290 stop:664 length:375 start_codon:yes stop_codon:yes gene_type:complete
MSIKLLLLKSGEDIISDVKEMNVGTEEDRKIVGYFLNKPCIVKMQDPSVRDDTEDDGKAQFSVALFPWMPLTKEDNIPIAADWLITMVEPIDKLKQMYIEDVVNYGQNNKGDSTGESSSADSGD